MNCMPHSENYKYKLDMVENFFPPCDKLNLTISNVNLYPTHGKLYETLIKQIKSYIGTDDAEVLLTHGSDGALKLLCNYYITKDATCLVLIPTYPHMMQYIKNKTNKIIYIDVQGEEDFEKFFTTPMPDVVYIVSPNAPRGYYFEPSQLALLIEQNSKTTFILDEAYVEYGPTSLVPLLKYDNVVITRTFSKFFGLAALRIGYLCCKDIKKFGWLYDMKTISICAMQNASIVLENLSFYKEQLTKFFELKAWLLRTLNEIIMDDAPIYKFHLQHAPLVILYCKDAEFVNKIFLNHNVVVRYKYGYIRFTIASIEAVQYVVRIIKFINIKQILAKSKIVFDLDDTLRIGTEGPIKHTLKQGDLIITNFHETVPQKLRETLNIKNKIIMALEEAKRWFSEHNKTVFVVGTKELQDYFESVKNADEILIINDFEQFYYITDILKKSKRLHILDPCSKTMEFVDRVNVNKAKIINLGKPDMKINLKDFKFFVGDYLPSDYEMAKKHNLEFIHINPSKSACVEDDFFTVPSVDYLL
jgi:histidinol-phosphate/aromatic aminotransferase/cobyric acid decarboxylase-like protein